MHINRVRAKTRQGGILLRCALVDLTPARPPGVGLAAPELHAGSGADSSVRSIEMGKVMACGIVAPPQIPSPT